MFCYNCGCKIYNEAQFCSNCGSKIQNNITNLNPEYQRSGLTKQNDEYNRDALKQHLYDLRSLECIKSKLENDITTIDNTVNHLAVPANLGNIPSGIGVEWEDIWPYLTFAGVAIGAGILLNIIGNWIFDSNIVLIIGIIIAVGIMALCIISALSDYSDHNNRIANYEIAKRNDTERVKNEEIEKCNLINLRENINNE